MIRSQSLFANCERPLVKPLGFAVTPLGVVDVSQSLQRGRELGVIRSQTSFIHYPEGTLCEPLCSIVLGLQPTDGSKNPEGRPQSRLVRLAGFFLDSEGAPAKPFCFGIVSLIHAKRSQAAQSFRCLQVVR